MNTAIDSPSQAFFSDEEVPLLRRRILGWFSRNGRDLPWRRTRDPYAVWVSEIMLQQTTTETVSGYFAPFLRRFPTIRALAEADLAEVLRCWEGLGYYRRARLLHRAAGEIVEKYGGVFPADRRQVEKLPGFGRYTTGAVLSFAFDRREPILEANTTRLHARLLAVEGDLARKENSAVLWDFAKRILPVRASGRFNQALIDLGRLICRPKTPLCGECPCAALCRAARCGWQNEIPSPKKRPVIENRTEVAFLIPRSVLTSGKRETFLFIRYPEHCRWGGLWDFPRFLREGEGAAANERLTELLQLFLGSDGVRPADEITRMLHSVTRYRITLLLRGTAGRVPKGVPSFFRTAGPSAAHAKVVIPFAGGAAPLDALEYRWLSLHQAEKIPLSSTGRELLRRLAASYAFPSLPAAATKPADSTRKSHPKRSSFHDERSLR